MDYYNEEEYYEKDNYEEYVDQQIEERLLEKCEKQREKAESIIKELYKEYKENKKCSSITSRKTGDSKFIVEMEFKKGYKITIEIPEEEISSIY
jgi:hypothetical protein